MLVSVRPQAQADDFSEFGGDKVTTRMLTIEVKSDDGKLIAVMTAPARGFKSGSRGFGAYGKVEVDGLRYQASLSFTEIGTKPKDNGSASKGEAAPTKTAEAEKANGKDASAILARAEESANQTAAALALKAGGGRPLNSASIGSAIKAKGVKAK